jgi:hypothetical protein
MPQAKRTNQHDASDKISDISNKHQDRVGPLSSRLQLFAIVANSSARLPPDSVDACRLAGDVGSQFINMSERRRLLYCIPVRQRSCGEDSSGANLRRAHFILSCPRVMNFSRREVALVNKPWGLQVGPACFFLGPSSSHDMHPGVVRFAEGRAG